MELVPWTIDDVIELGELEKQCFSDPWSIYSLAEAVNFERFVGISLKNDDGKIVGYYGYYCLPPEAHIANVAVQKDFRGLGYSKILMTDLIERAKKDEISDYTLEVRKSNQVAINLYEKFGFKQEGLRKKYYGDGEDAVIMWRR